MLDVVCGWGPQYDGLSAVHFPKHLRYRMYIVFSPTQKIGVYFNVNFYFQKTFRIPTEI